MPSLLDNCIKVILVIYQCKVTIMHSHNATIQTKQPAASPQGGADQALSEQQRIQEVIQLKVNKHTPLFAMHNSVVSLFLCSVTRDGEQKAEQGDFIIPAVFILHPTDFCTSHPSSSLVSFHFFIISLHPSPIYTYPILSTFKSLTLSLTLYFTILFFYSIRILLTFPIPSFSITFFQGFSFLFFIPSPPCSSFSALSLLLEVIGEAKSRELKCLTSFLSSVW